MSDTGTITRQTFSFSKKNILFVNHSCQDLSARYMYCTVSHSELPDMADYLEPNGSENRAKWILIKLNKYTCSNTILTYFRAKNNQI